AVGARLPFVGERRAGTGRARVARGGVARRVAAAVVRAVARSALGRGGAHATVCHPRLAGRLVAVVGRLGAIGVGAARVRADERPLTGRAVAGERLVGSAAEPIARVAPGVVGDVERAADVVGAGGVDAVSLA